LLEIEDHPIYAIPEPGRRGAVMKNMTKMRPAAPAFHLRPLHPISLIRQIDDTAFADRLVKTWPAAAALEFGITLEERIAAYRAIISADLMILFQRTAVRPLGPLLSSNGVDI